MLRLFYIKPVRWSPMKPTKRIVGFLSLLALASAVPCYSQDPECQVAITVQVVLVADGTAESAAIPSTQTAAYFPTLLAGRSYSVKITTGEVSNADPTIAACDLMGNLIPSADTTGASPQVLSVVGRRLSITPAVSNTYIIRFTNNSTLGDHVFTGVVEETTLFNPAWSTFGTFETFYSCTNTTTTGTLDAILKLFDTTGAEVASFDFTDLPAGGTVSRNTGSTSLNVANGLNGSATLVHNGPPGAFLCEAAIADFATAPRVIQPVKFEPTRQMR